MICRSQRAVWPPDFAAGILQAFECLLSRGSAHGQHQMETEKLTGEVTSWTRCLSLIWSQYDIRNATTSYTPYRCKAKPSHLLAHSQHGPGRPCRRASEASCLRTAWCADYLLRHTCSWIKETERWNEGKQWVPRRNKKKWRWTAHYLTCWYPTLELHEHLEGLSPIPAVIRNGHSADWPPRLPTAKSCSGGAWLSQGVRSTVSHIPTVKHVRYLRRSQSTLQFISLVYVSFLCFYLHYSSFELNSFGESRSDDRQIGMSQRCPHGDQLFSSEHVMNSLPATSFVANFLV